MIALVLSLAIQGPALRAELFPPGAPVPGYVGIRVRVRAAGPVRDRLRVEAGGNSTSVSFDLPAGRERDVVVAVWRAAPGDVTARLGGATAIAAEGESAPRALVAGGLEAAERASDLFGLPLTRVVRLDPVPELLDPAALDGFAGLLAEGLPRALVDGFAARGGAVAPHGVRPEATPRALRAPRGPVLAAVAAPPDGLRPRDFLGPASPPVRVALAAGLVGVLSALFLAKRPRLALLAGLAAAAVGALGAVALARELRPRIEIGRPAEAVFPPAVALTPAPEDGEIPEEVLPYPCGKGLLARSLDGGRTLYAATTATLLATAVPHPWPFDRPFEPLPEATFLPPAPRLRAVAAALLGDTGARLAIDSAAGLLRLEPPIR